MTIATVTSKGQITIPQEIRLYLGLHTGDKAEFFIEADGRVIITPLTVEAKDLKGMLPKPKKPVTIEQMNKAIRKRGIGSHERD